MKLFVHKLKYVTDQWHLVDNFFDAVSVKSGSTIAGKNIHM